MIDFHLKASYCQHELIPFLGAVNAGLRRKEVDIEKDPVKWGICS